jgi:hypothetical protein
MVRHLTDGPRVRRRPDGRRLQADDRNLETFAALNRENGAIAVV